MNDGDFIKVNFEMYVGEDRKLVSTTNMQLAKEKDIFDEKQKYREAVLIVGSENIFKEINESFKKAEEGKEYEVEIKANDAYGLRDPKNIKVHTFREFQRQNIEPSIGQEVSLNGRRGKVVSITPGRIIVDYNHQWAGKDVFYKYSVTGKVEDNSGKVKALIDYNYNVDSESFEVREVDSEIEVVVPEQTKFDPMWLESKYRIVSDVRKYLPGKTVKLSEVYKVEEEKSEEKPQESKEDSGSNKEESTSEKKLEEENTN